MSTTAKGHQIPVIEAAGGVIERQSPEGVLVALVRRSRYGNEWVIPKGKRKNGESWQETALREVLEETGLKVSISGLAGCTSYVVGSTPKIVLYWRMKLKEEPSEFAPNEETKELRWLSPKKAERLLTYQEDFDLLQAIFSPAAKDRSSENAGRPDEVRLPRWFPGKPLGRLAGNITAKSLELAGRAVTSPNLGRNLWRLEEGLRQARTAVCDRRVDDGWKCLLAVERTALLYLSDEDLRAEALAMRKEAAKLNSWRKAAVLELLATGDGASFTPERVYKAATLRDEHYHNEAYKDRLRRGTALTLACTLTLATVALLLMAYGGQFLDLENTWKNDSFGLGFVMLLALVGLLGANVSAITDLAQSQVSARIPEAVATFRITILRLFIGTASAIFLFFVIRAGVLFNQTGPYGMLGVAFAGGFSEKLVLRVVRSITEKGEPR